MSNVLDTYRLLLSLLKDDELIDHYLETPVNQPAKKDIEEEIDRRNLAPHKWRN